MWQQQRCTSPYGLPAGGFLILPGERAIIEMAQSCGLELTPPAQRMCVRPAATAGRTGKGGAGRRVSAFDYRPGGSATNDGGIGFARALGARFAADGTLLPAPAAGQDSGAYSAHQFERSGPASTAKRNTGLLRCH